MLVNESRGELYPPLSSEASELIGKVRAARFGDPAHPILVLGFGKCRADEFFGDFLGNQSVEPSRMLVAAYFKHLENQAANADLFCGRQAVVCRLAVRERLFKTVNV
jgi:hypothetical protein